MSGEQARAADDIHAAVRRNDLAAVRAIVAADPTTLKDQSGNQSPLHEAACYVTPEMVKLLIELGADVNATAYNRFTPLHVVKDAESAKALIKAGADLTKIDSWGKTPLQSATPVIAEAMIEAGAKVDLATAVRLRKKDLVKKLLADDPDAAAPQDGGSDLWGSTSPLGIAARQGDLEIVQLLVAAGAPIDQGTSMPNAGGDATALTNAVWAGHTEVVRFLLGKGASTNTTGGKYYDSLFDYAVKHSKPEIVELLVTYGAAKPGQGRRHTSSLATAAAGGNLPVVTLILKHEAALFTDEDLRRALFLAALGGHVEVTKLLLSKGAVADVFTSAVMGDAEAVGKELDRDPTLVNSHDKIIERSLLGWSILANQEDVVRLLLKRKANVKETSDCPLMSSQLYEFATPDAGADRAWYAKQKETPISVAIGEEGRPGASHTIVRLLLEHAATPDGADEVRGMSPLANAVHLGKVEAVKSLIEHKADVNAKDRSGSPVLLWAVDSPEMAKLLLDAGANPNATDNEGRSMLEAALDWPEPQVANMLIAKGAKLTLRAACMLGKTDFVREAVTADKNAVGPFAGSRFKETPLLLAAAGGRTETVRVLLDAGAKLDYVDLQGYTAFYRASESGDVATIALLL
ncbi:MAG TPA: ankyrin repeat domain-containing protein, partial [Phycisphaerales bacterium]|nr:ankyrin repeat domain-containing protein [Phycisphaerales bacterium]